MRMTEGCDGLAMVRDLGSNSGCQIFVIHKRNMSDCGSEVGRENQI